MTYSDYMLSKLYIEPTKKNVSLVKFYNVILILAIIGSIIGFMTTQKIQNLAYIFLAFFIVERFKARKENTGYLDVSGMQINIDEQGIYLKYDKNNVERSFLFREILEMSYTDQKNCLVIKDNNGTNNIYLEAEKKDEILKVLRNNYPKEITER